MQSCLKSKVYIVIDRFTNEEDKDWFEAAISKVVKQNVGEEYFPKLAKEPYFVDFLRDAPEPTGEEDEDADFDAPKIYEEVCFKFHGIK